MKKVPAWIVLLLLSVTTKAQNVGIGTTTPIALLHVADSNVLFTGPNPFVNYNPAQQPPAQGPGTRLMWYSQKGAFRAGWVEDDRWNKDSIGVFSIGMGHSVLASNTGTVALGVRSNARGFGAAAIGWGSDAASDYSFAAGYSSVATGSSAVAIGTESRASGIFSASLGIHATATGNSAVAIGDSAIASGTQSVAAGSYVTAKARASFATGWYNDNTDSPDPVGIAATDRIFQVGNGNGFLATRSNAFTILRNANTGIGITTPRFPLSFNNNNGDKISLYDDGNPGQVHFGFGIASAQLLQVFTATTNDDIAFGTGSSSSFTERMRIKGNGKVGINTLSPVAHLHVADSNVVFTGPLTIPVSTPYSPAIEGAGTRLMWYPQKAAFRAGNVDGTQWDKSNIGNYSFAAGQNAKASGNNATALGKNVNANGEASVALGEFSTTNDQRATAIGYVAMANGYATTAIGFGPVANGNYSVSIGSNTQSNGGASVSIGDNAKSTGTGAVSIGNYTRARSDYSFVAGKYNDSTATNRLFEIGNGTAENARSNAMTILQNGNTGVGVLNPLARMHVDSSVLFTTSNFLPASPAQTPVTGAGFRTLWYADKAAFRTGGVSNSSWDRDNIGVNSFAAGFSTQALGITSTAFGNFAFATGDISFAAGNSVFAKAKHAAAFGTFNDITDAPTSTEAAGDRIFQVGNGASNVSRANALTILRNGNMGIGNLNPARPLSFPALLGEKIQLFPAGSGEVGIGVYNNEFRLHTDYNGADITFGYQTNTPVFTETMRIKGTGFVGIGTSNPTRPLSFPASLGEKILLYPGGSGEVGIGVYGNELRLHCDNPGSMVSFGTQDNAGVFTQAGRFQLTGGYGLYVNGNIWANGTTYASDARFKEDITPIQSPLQKLLQINGVEYKMRAGEFPGNNFSKKKQMGLLAQNVEQVVPEAVNELDGYKGVDYAKLVPLLIESIKEQQKQIEELRKENQEFRQQLKNK